MTPARNPTKAEALASEHAHLPYRPDIDGLRAIAVLLVVGFHAFPRFFKGGFVGVDIFFVISGFLISGILFRSLENGSFRFVDFYSRRIRRIFPALLVIFIVSLAFGWFALFPDEYKQLGKHVAGGAGFISNIILWWESGYFDTANELKPMLHLWSLGIEEQFYLVWPLILWLVWEKRFNLLTLTALVAVVSFGLNLAKYRFDPVYDFYSPQTRFWELLAGAMLAYVTLHPPKMKWIATFREKFSVGISRALSANNKKRNESMWYNFLSFFGILLIVFVAFKLKKEHLFPGVWAVLPVLGAVCLIVSGSKAWVNRKILSNRVLVWVGLISYPLYLWHWPLLSFARIIDADKPSRTIRIAAVLLSIILAWLTYRLIERPLRFGKHGKRNAVALLLLMLVVGLCGLYVKNTRGLPKRQSVAAYKEKMTLYEPATVHCAKIVPEFKELEWTTPAHCVLNKDSAPSIVFVGDSHMWHHINAIVNHFDSIPVLIVATPTCFPSFSGDSVRANECKKRHDALLRYLEKRPSVKTVVFSGYYEHLMTAGKHDIKGEGWNIPAKPHADDAASFKANATALFSTILESGKKIVFMKDNPSLDFNIKRCFPRPLRISPHSIPNGDCAIDYGKYKERTASSDAVIEEILSKFPAIQVYDPKPLFCRNNRCKASDSLLSYYSDYNHLSHYGADMVITDLIKNIHFSNQVTNDRLAPTD